MRLQTKVVAGLLLLLLTGCIHKSDQAQNQPPLAPPIVDTPPPKPDNAPINLPPPVVTVPQPAQTAPPPPQEQAPPPKPAPKRRKSTQKPAPSTQPQQQPAQVASNDTPQVPAIGQLSSGEPADLKKQTADSIADTERGLKDINRKLSDQEQKTSTQIKEFLKQARTALAAGDIDGAHTLALKAKVLLSELSQ